MVKAREFQHESYTKWMNFFYVAEAAVLFAYIKSNPDWHIQLSLLGFVFSLLAYLSCRGFYFWTHNWIDQIYRLEREFKVEHRIYSTFSKNTKDESNILRLLEPANLSTSKLTILFFLLIYWLWSFLLARNSLEAIHLIPKDLHVNSLVFCVCTAGLLLIVSFFIVYVFRKKLETHWLNENDFDRWINCRNERV